MSKKMGKGTPGLSRTKQKRVSQLGDARRGLLTALGTAGLLTEQEGDLLRVIIDRVQAQATDIVGDAAQDIMDQSPI
jgi:hypothetical protein